MKMEGLHNIPICSRQPGRHRAWGSCSCAAGHAGHVGHAAAGHALRKPRQPRDGVPGAVPRVRGAGAEGACAGNRGAEHAAHCGSDTGDTVAGSDTGGGESSTVPSLAAGLVAGRGRSLGRAPLRPLV